MSVIMNYYRHIDRSKIQFDFLCFLPCETLEQSHEREIEELGGQVFFIHKPQLSFTNIYEIKNFFLSIKGHYEWFFNHEVYLSFFLKSMVRYAEIKKIAICSHATCFSDSQRAAWRNRILCIPIRFINAEKFACSEAAGVFLYGKKALQCNDIKIIHNAVNTQLYSFDLNLRNSLRKTLNLEQKFVIGHVGRFSPQKNHIFLLKVFGNLVQLLPQAHLVLIGEGPLLKEIRDYVRQEHLSENVSFLGSCLNVNQILNMMDLFVLPSLYEGLPLACVEAEMNGLPCVVSSEITTEVDFSKPGRLEFCALDIKNWEDKCAKRYYIWENEDIRTRKEASLYAQKAAIHAHFSIESEADEFQKLIISNA